MSEPTPIPATDMKGERGRHASRPAASAFTGPGIP